MFVFENHNKYSPSISRWIDEIYAHKFANHHGGSPLNTEYYNRNVNSLKGTTLKIDAEKLILPSFD